MRVKDLPAADRPRERLLANGAEALADRELLVLILGSGTAGCDAVDWRLVLLVDTAVCMSYPGWTHMNSLWTCWGSAPRKPLGLRPPSNLDAVRLVQYGPAELG
jgi:hypothetical protein